MRVRQGHRPKCNQGNTTTRVHVQTPNASLKELHQTIWGVSILSLCTVTQNLCPANLVSEPPATEVRTISVVPVVQEDLHILVASDLLQFLINLTPMVETLLHIIANECLDSYLILRKGVSTRSGQKINDELNASLRPVRCTALPRLLKNKFSVEITTTRVCPPCPSLTW